MLLPHPPSAVPRDGTLSSPSSRCLAEAIGLAWLQIATGIIGLPPPQSALNLPARSAPQLGGNSVNGIAHGSPAPICWKSCVLLDLS